MKRREFLQDTALAAAAAVGPTLPLAGSLERHAPNNVAWHKAPCRLCGVGCGLLVGIDNGRAVAAKGDPDSPVSAGLPCVKGYHAAQALYGSDRITRALVRRDGRLEPVPLTTALDLIARVMRETLARHGADSVAMYGSAQWTVTDAWLASRLFDALGAKRLATSARLDSANAIAALQAAFGAPHSPGCHEDVDHADVFVLWDANLAETDPVLFSRILERKRANPSVRIVDLATRTTRTSYAADESLIIAPGGTLAIARAICRELVERGLLRRHFVNKHVAFRRQDGALLTDSSLDEYREGLHAFTAEHAQRSSGLTAANIRWIASLYGDHTKRVMSIWGASLNTRPGGFEVNSALLDVHLLTGRIASPGNAAFAAPTHTGAGNLAPLIGETDPLSLFRLLERGDVAFLWIQAANPMVTLPNLAGRRERAGGVTPFIVVSEVYPTATTEIADVVLPSAMWIEREGIVVNGERRVQHCARLVRPPRDATSDGWQIIQIARRLGLAQRFPRASDALVGDCWKEMSRSRPARETLPSLTELRGRPGVLWPAPSGREAKWLYNTAHDPTADSARGDFDFYGHDDRRAWIILRADEPPVGEIPNSRYPFRLATGPVLEHSGSGSITRRIPVLRRAVPAAYAELNRSDAVRLNIADGDTVRLVSRRGFIECVARIELRSQPPRGTVFVPSFDPAVPVQMLTADAQSPATTQPEPGACAVRIERLSAKGATG